MLWTISAENDHDYGYKAGRSRERLFRAALRLAAGGLRRCGADPARVADRSRCHLDLLESRYPAYGERLNGLARALGVDQGEVTAAALALPWILKAGCTNFAAVPPATADGRIYVSWNLDLSPLFRLLIGRMPLFIRDVEGAKPYVCIGLPILFGIGVMNGEGLCGAVNSVGAMDGGEGLTFFELNNLAMETKGTVRGAIEVWKDNPREVAPGLAIAIILNANSIFADMEGEAVVLEHSHNHIAVEEASRHGGILASANHHQFLDRSLSGGADPGMEPLIAGSFARLARMWELLGKFRGEIEPRTIKLIASDHGLNYISLEEFGCGRKWYDERVDDATICCHPWNFFHHLRRLELEEAVVEFNIAKTLNHILMDPRRCTIYMTLGNPCRKQYVPIWLGDALRMEWADRAREEIGYEPGMKPPSHSVRKDVFRRPNPSRNSEFIRSIGISLFGALDRAISGSLVQQK